jgi:hypothetical protein
MYSRSFLGGVRRRLGEEDLKILSSKQRAAHDHLGAYQDKHVAHSVNGFEESVPRAKYCVERVKEEGITSISYGGGRVTGIGGVEVNAIIELTNVFEAHI